VAQTRPALSPLPSPSIVLYRLSPSGTSGRIRTGILDEETYTQRGSFRTARWSHIVVGRDSMAMYHKGSGRLVLGTLKNGRFREKSRRRIAKGFTHVTASCDTIAFYREGTGTLLTAEFTSGAMRDRRTTTLGASYFLIDASCDSMLLREGIQSDIGDLDNGHFRDEDGLVDADPWTDLAADRTSILAYQGASGEVTYFRMTDGDLGSGTTGSVQIGLEHVRGVGDDILFYEGSTGATFRWRLINGFVNDSGPGPTLPQGLTLIAGGR
jgi:hypothetical protein